MRSSKLFQRLTITAFKMSNGRRFIHNISTIEEAKIIAPQLPIFWYDEVSSTMDTARDFVKSNSNREDIFAVVAQKQSRGRGTRGRSWMYGSKNLLMTIAIKRTVIPIQLHLLPLRVGTLIADAVRPLITSNGSMLKLKWPNDVLINGKKVCGILIEMENDHLLIGIGCNVMTAPEVTALGPEAGRSSTALYLHNEEINQQKITMEISNRDQINLQAHHEANDAPVSYNLQECDYHELLAIRIMLSFQQWIAQKQDSSDDVITDFSRQMDFSEQRLRDVNDPTKNRIQPIGLNSDGTLQVRYCSNGSEDCLVADYLW